MAQGSSALTRDDILQFLREVDEELATSADAGLPLDILLCGGAAMALLGLRNSTLDIDSVTPLSPELKRATQRVAANRRERHVILNDAAAAWKPANLIPRQCPLVMDGKQLRVYRLDYDSLFLMKLNASRPHASDLQDLASLAPFVSFDSPASIQEAYEAAYPGTFDDPHIGDFAWKRYFSEPGRTA